MAPGGRAQSACGGIGKCVKGVALRAVCGVLLGDKVKRRRGEKRGQNSGAHQTFSGMTRLAILKTGPHSRMRRLPWPSH
jgi:hypothetical protein